MRFVILIQTFLLLLNTHTLQEKDAHASFSCFLVIKIGLYDTTALKTSDYTDEQGSQKFISTLNKANLSKITSRFDETLTAFKHEIFVDGKDSSMTKENRLSFKSGEVKASIK